MRIMHIINGFLIYVYIILYHVRLYAHKSRICLRPINHFMRFLNVYIFTLIEGSRERR